MFSHPIDIYEDYFENDDDATRCEQPEAKTVHVFRDPTLPYKRPVSSVSWCPDGGSKIVIAYCNLEFQATHPDTTKESYIFNIDDPTEPNLVLDPPHFLVSLLLYFWVKMGDQKL